MFKLSNVFNPNFSVNRVALLNIIRGKVAGNFEQNCSLNRDDSISFRSLIAVNYEARGFGVKRGE